MLGGRRILRVMPLGKLGDGRAPRTHLNARARAWTQARTYKDAGESDGARMWMEKAARAGMSGGSAHRGLSERGASTALIQCNYTRRECRYSSSEGRKFLKAGLNWAGSPPQAREIWVLQPKTRFFASKTRFPPRKLG